jgi:hypothetical protein
VWPINADNGVDDSAREQVRKWTIKPATDKNGQRVQVDGPISFYFETRIENPLPELSDAEVRALATNIVEPAWPANSVHSGQVVEVEISVNEEGRFAGASFPHVIPVAAMLALDKVMHQWTFRPFVKDGKAQYFKGKVKFVVK